VKREGKKEDYLSSKRQKTVIEDRMRKLKSERGQRTSQKSVWNRGQPAAENGRFSSMEKVTEVQDGWTAGQVGTLGC
jgi:hypothetical protein